MTIGFPILWRFDADTASDWRSLLPAPATNIGFAEKRRCLFQKPGPGFDLFVDDEPLPDHPCTPPCWAWEPGFFAGEVTAELVGADGAIPILFLLDVAPDPTKVGRDSFARMVDELWKEDPILVIGSEPATAPSGALGESEDPWTAFARLRRWAPDTLRALAYLKEHPRQALRSRRDSVPIHMVRRVDRRTATALLRSPAIASFLPDAKDVGPFALDSRMDVPLVEATLDSSANRTMLALVLLLLRRTRTVAERLEKLVDSDDRSEARTSLSVRWTKRKQFLEDLAAELKMLLRRSPFADVRRAEITAAGLTAIDADPLYSCAWSRGSRALRRGIECDISIERLWISPSWEIYERWCYLRIGKLLSAQMPAWNWRRLPDRWVGSRDRYQAELLLQPVFPANRPGPGRFWSISRQRVPDIVFKVERAGNLRFVVLDAKYRASRANVLDAMESAHIYQDSLRIGSQRPEGSLLVVPAPGGASWLEAPAFQQEHRVGVHALSPDVDATLPNLVTALLGDWEKLS